MKNVTGLKWIIVANALAVTLLVYQSCGVDARRTNDVGSVDDSLAIAIEKGRYLAHYVTGCIDCHSQRDFSQFSGPVVAGTEGMGGEVFGENVGLPGVVYARNITSDTAYGIGTWSDEEVATAITKGISKRGDTLFPVMPYYHFNTMSREDVNNIVAYIRTLKPINEKIKDRKLFIPISTAYGPLPSNDIASNKKPPVSEMVQYGGYIVNAAACMDCHTVMDKGKFVIEKMFAGGFMFNMDEFKVVSANITPDSTTGIGKWTEEMFVDKFKSYKDPVNYRTDPGKQNTVMPWTLFAQMDEFDLKAVYRYLRTIPPVKHLVTKHP